MIVEIDNLHKSFKDVKAVDDISFRVKEGELFAFLGVNGAGKSTTINQKSTQTTSTIAKAKIVMRLNNIIQPIGLLWKVFVSIVNSFNKITNIAVKDRTIIKNWGIET